MTAISCVVLGSEYWRYADPIGAIVIAVYIIVSWCITAYGKSSESLFV